MWGEISGAGALGTVELLGTLEYVVKQAVRTRGTYKRRQDKSIRKFGGGYPACPGPSLPLPLTDHAAPSNGMAGLGGAGGRRHKW